MLLGQKVKGLCRVVSLCVVGVLFGHCEFGCNYQVTNTLDRLERLYSEMQKSKVIPRLVGLSRPTALGAGAHFPFQ